MLSIFDRLVIACSARLYHIIMILWISFEGDFAIAVGAFEVEPEDLDAQICLLIANFHSHVKLGADVQVICTSVTPQRHWQHIPYHHQLVLTTSSLLYSLMIEVLREILD